MRRSTSFEVEGGKYKKRSSPSSKPTFEIYSDEEEEPSPPPPENKKQENSELKKRFNKGVPLYLDKSYEEALKAFQIASLLTNQEDEVEEIKGAIAHVQNRLGYQCILAKDYEKAKEWFLKSAKNKNGAAYYNLGLMTMKGDGVEVYNFDALRYFSKAFELGHQIAQKCMWRVQKKIAYQFYCKNQYKMALALLKQIKDEGCKTVIKAILETQFQIGIQLYRAEKYDEAIAWWKYGAEHGHQESIEFNRLAHKKGSLNRIIESTNCL